MLKYLSKVTPLALLLSMQHVMANAPERSVIPQLRPESIGAASLGAAANVPRVVTVPVFYNPTTRPTLRPQAGQVVASGATAVASGVILLPATVPGVQRSVIPTLRPQGLAQRRVAQASTTASAATAPASETRAQRRQRERDERRAERQRSNQPRSGSVCGDRSIRGEEVSAIAGTMRGCGVSNPVRITEVDGVALTQAATINCDTARALKTWINDGVRPAVGRLGGGVASIRVIASYSCRTRNNRAGAKVSEHGKGNALDIAAINLKNGADITVLTGWRTSPQRELLRQMHRSACGPFGTVLGPEADRYHQDHFHFDVARHRSGSYCR